MAHIEKLFSSLGLAVGEVAAVLVATEDVILHPMHPRFACGRVLGALLKLGIKDNN